MWISSNKSKEVYPFLNKFNPLSVEYNGYALNEKKKNISQGKNEKLLLQDAVLIFLYLSN